MAANELVLEATIEKVEHDMSTGWYRIHTRDPKARLDTKITEKAQEAAELIEKRALIFHTEQPSKNINPHTGQPYAPNKYYERASEVALGMAAAGGGIQTIGQPTPATNGPTTPQREFSGGMSAEDKWRVTLLAGAKLAVSTLPLLPRENQTFESQKQIAIAWAKWAWFTPMPSDLIGTNVVAMPALASIDPTDPAPDDIPF